MSQTSTTQSFDFSKDYDDMTTAEKRAKIAHQTGHRPPKTCLPKSVWNSLHAWFTGEFYSQLLVKGRPPKHRLVLTTVCEMCNTADLDGESPLWEYHTELAHLVAHHERHALNLPDVPHLRDDELHAVLDAMDTVDDKRSWLD